MAFIGARLARPLAGLPGIPIIIITVIRSSVIIIIIIISVVIIIIIIIIIILSSFSFAKHCRIFLRPVSTPRIFELRFVGSNFPGSSLWAWEFHP